MMALSECVNAAKQNIVRNADAHVPFNESLIPMM